MVVLAVELRIRHYHSKWSNLVGGIVLPAMQEAAVSAIEDALS
jgi:hypothetical protein